MHFLEPEQVDTLAEAIDDRYRVLIYAAAYAKLRAGDLKARNLNLRERTLHVSPSASEIHGYFVVGPT